MENHTQEKLSTLRALDRKRSKTELGIKELRKQWSSKIAEGRENLKAVIETDNPLTVVACEERLNGIREILAGIEEDELCKRVEVGQQSEYLKKIQNAIFEIIRSEPSDQIDLDLGDAPGANAIRVTAESADVIGSLDDGTDIEDAMEAMGVSGLTLVVDPTVEQEEEEDEEEDEEEAAF